MSTTLKEGLIWCDPGAHSYSQGKHQQPSLNMLEQAPMDPQPLLMMLLLSLEEPRQCRCCMYTTLLNRAADIDAETYV